MTKHRKIFGLLLAAVLGLGMLGVAGCKKPKDEGGDDVRIWSTYATRKVMQSFGEYDDLGAKLDVLMAKGETEGAQLVITPSGDVKSAVLKKADLKADDGTVFSKDAIDVYMQKYVNVVRKTSTSDNPHYPTGYTPDMLLPMETAEKFGETGVAAGNNQGFTVEFTTTAATKPATYTGVFVLDVDGKTTDIPVTVEVADIDITKRYGQTYIAFLSGAQMAGDYDNAGDTYTKYYETSLNDYKFCPSFLPGSGDPVKLVANVKKYWDNPSFTTYSLPITMFTETRREDDKTVTDINIAYGELYSYIYALAKASEDGKILLDRAICYPEALDEPFEEAKSSNVEKCVKQFYEIEDKVVADLEAEGFFDGKSADFVQALKTSITHIPFIQTATVDMIDKFGSSVNTYCPLISYYDLPAWRKKFADMKTATANRGGESWYYTCIQPIFPYPSHHIDDSMLGARVMRWMQKDYGLDGYLHWSFDAFFSYTITEPNINPYEEPQRFPNSNGDGSMFYPGSKYGIDTYIPSIRLAAFRDGQEDYDMLNALDERIREKETYYGLTAGEFNADSLVSDLYDKLYGGTVYADDDANFYAVRKQLFDIIGGLNSGSNYFLMNSVVGNNAESKIYLGSGYTLTVNGETPTVVSDCGQGKVYTVTQSLTGADATLEIVVSKDGSEVERHSVFVSAAIKNVTLGENATQLRVPTDSEVSYSNGKANVTLNVRTDEDVSALFKPFVRIMGAGVTETLLTDIDNVYVNVKNVGSESVTLKARVYTSYGTDVYEYDLASGETVDVSVLGIYGYGTAMPGLENGNLELYIDNTGNGAQLEISDLRYTLKREVK